MVDTTAAVLLIGSFFGLMALTVPILFAMIGSSVVTILYLGLPVELVVLNMVKGINIYSLMSVPFFILAGELMSQGGIIDRLRVTLERFGAVEPGPGAARREVRLHEAPIRAVV